MKTSIFTIIFITTCSLLSGQQRFTGIKHVKTFVSDIFYNHAVMAKAYSEYPGHLVVTTRGNGLTIINISEPEAPVPVMHWGSGKDVEGQSLFIIDEIKYLAIVERLGLLHILKVRENSIDLVSSIDLGLSGGPLATQQEWNIWIKMSYLARGPFAALHTDVHEINGRKYAIVAGTYDQKLLIVDVSEPENPKLASKTNAMLKMFESVALRDHYLFTGGVDDDRFHVTDLSDPQDPRIVKTKTAPFIRQMVSGVDPLNKDILYSALWGHEKFYGGGIAIWDISQLPDLKLLSKISIASAAKANRIKFAARNRLVFTPFETKDGGFGVYDVRNPMEPVFLGSFSNESGFDMQNSYTMEVHPNENYVYSFSQKNNSMSVLKIQYEHLKDSNFRSFRNVKPLIISKNEQIEWNSCSRLSREMGICKYDTQPRHIAYDQISYASEPINLKAQFAFSDSRFSLFGYHKMEKENVDIHLYDFQKEEWQFMARTLTDENGESEYQLSDGLPIGKYLIRYLVPADDNTSYEEYRAVTAQLTVISKLEPQRAVIWDIDGTLTKSNIESLQELLNSKVAETYEGSQLLQLHYNSKRILNICISGRPDFLLPETRLFLKENGYNCDFVQHTRNNSESIPGQTTVRYKLEILKNILSLSNLKIVRAYGNAATDVEAYLQAGISESEIFVITDSKSEYQNINSIKNSYMEHYHNVIKN